MEIRNLIKRITSILYIKPSELLLTLKGEYGLFIFIVNLVYTFAFDLPIYYIYKKEGFFSSSFLLRSYILTLLLNIAVFFSLSLFRCIFYISLPLLFFISAITTFLIVNFKVTLNMNAVALVFETNLHEASGVAGREMIIFIIISLIISLVILFVFYKKIKPVSKKAIIYLILIQTLIINYPVMKIFSFNFRGIPNDLYLYTVKYLKEKRESIKLSRKRVDLTEIYRFKYKGDDIVVVMIIGEAERGYNWSMNGYHRETDRNMKSLGVISYKNASSCGTITRVSVPCMLTRATFNDRDISKREKSAISIFNSLGFETYWISNQGVMGEHETPITPIINESHNKIFVNITGAFEDRDVLDENIITVFKNVIGKRAERLFIVVHLIGSHWYYEHHYTENFRVFKPVCESKFAQKCSKEELINSYDNSLLYTDWVVSQLIKAVSDRNSLVFFVSDHGESLGEDGVYTHWVQHINRKEQRSVAWFVYASDEYKKRHGDFYNNIVNNRDKHISHDNLFHSLLDCTSIESEAIDRSLSLCREIKE